MLYWRGNVCGLDTVFRDDGGESEGTSSTWAAALGAVLGNEKIEDTVSVGRVWHMKIYIYIYLYVRVYN